jgi:predicted phage baseplate assembly protein
VAQASHGATVASATLGSGDASLAFQQFELPHPNLTVLPAASGPNASTLVVSVNGIPWAQVPDLTSAAPTDTSYEVQIDPDGTARVCFGDGVHGARLPDGTGNVVATYRTGSGPSGHLGPATLTVLLGAPLGIMGVTNPLATDETTAAEAPADAVTQVLDRGQAARTIVTPNDYVYLAQSFPGIAKVSVAVGAGAGRRVVTLTVARAPGALPDTTDAELVTALTQFLDSARLATDRLRVPLAVQVAPVLHFGVDVSLTRAAGPAGDVCGTALAADLEAAFGFAQRQIGQGVTSAEVLATIQRSAGVGGAFLQALACIPGADAPAPAPSYGGTPPGVAPMTLPASVGGTPALLLFEGDRSVTFTIS